MAPLGQIRSSSPMKPCKIVFYYLETSHDIAWQYDAVCTGREGCLKGWLCIPSASACTSRRSCVKCGTGRQCGETERDGLAKVGAVSALECHTSKYKKKNNNSGIFAYQMGLPSKYTKSRKGLLPNPRWTSHFLTPGNIS